MNNINNNLVEKALIKAIELHKGQVRKGDGKIPYVVHPIEVGIIVARYTNNPELVASAILHDTVEDCNYSLGEKLGFCFDRRQNNTRLDRQKSRKFTEVKT